ncbi:MAG: hypothetical protein ACLFMT_00980 [Halobacteriales archaeon]
MVNQDPSNVDLTGVPEATEPVERDNHDNYMAGVYRTTEDGVYVLQVFDWANRVVEATVYDVDRDEETEEDGVVRRPLDVPGGMDVEAHLVDLLGERVDALADEIAAEA